jgi:hypothetical protein
MASFNLPLWIVANQLAIKRWTVLEIAVSVASRISPYAISQGSSLRQAVVGKAPETCEGRAVRYCQQVTVLAVQYFLTLI